MFKGESYLDLVSKLKDPAEKEYYQIIRKYTDSFELIDGDQYHYQIKMRPLLYEKEINLHFDYQEETLDVEIDARKYPKEKATFRVTNPSIPSRYKEKFEEIFDKAHANRNLFDTLKTIQNNFEKVYNESNQQI